MIFLILFINIKNIMKNYLTVMKIWNLKTFLL